MNCKKGGISYATYPDRRQPTEINNDFCADKNRAFWAWFAAGGASIGASLRVPTSLEVFEFGVWAHSPVKVGHSLGNGFKTIAMDPPIFVSAEPLITAEDAQDIIVAAANKISDEPESEEAGFDGSERTGDGDEQLNSTKTSSVAWLSPVDGAAVKKVFALGEKLFKATSLNHVENLQVVRYLPGENHHQHVDFLKFWELPALTLARKKIFKLQQQGFANRVGTLMLYLSDTPGALTNFPRADNAQQTNLTACGAAGVSVSAHLGTAVMFYSMMPNGTLLDNAVHVGCPVPNGALKWVANLWFWNSGKVSNNSVLFSQHVHAEL